MDQFLECSVKMCKVALEVYRKHFVLWVLCCRALKDMAVCEEGSVCVCCVSQTRTECKHTEASPIICILILFYTVSGQQKGCVIQPSALCIFPQAQSKIYISIYLSIFTRSIFFHETNLFERIKLSMGMAFFHSVMIIYACIHMLIYVHTHTHALFMPLVSVCCLPWIPVGHFLYCHSLKNSQGNLYYKKREKRHLQIRVAMKKIKHLKKKN